MIAKYISNFVSFQNVFTHLLILLRFYYYTMKIGIRHWRGERKPAETLLTVKQ